VTIIVGHAVSRETAEKLDGYAALLLEENARQNLISKSSVSDLWSRHIVDSLQLLDHAPANARWLDIGSGPGLPGMVLAIAGVREITLVEPRRLRTDFLERCCSALQLTNVKVITGKVELRRPYRARGGIPRQVIRPWRAVDCGKWAMGAAKRAKRRKGTGGGAIHVAR